DSFTEHPKVAALTDAALAAHTRGLCYCARHLTDGRIPRAAARRLGTPKALRELVAGGLWYDHGDHFQVHDYLEWNPSAAEVEERRQKRAASGRLGGIRSGKSRRQRQANAEANAEASAEASASALAQA